MNDHTDVRFLSLVLIHRAERLGESLDPSCAVARSANFLGCNVDHKLVTEDVQAHLEFLDALATEILTMTKDTGVPN